VLSVFFGFGIVLLTVIQTMSAGRQAGLEGFLLGSTAGMLFSTP
jgi:manganese/zinc/iron transport system permease protein